MAYWTVIGTGIEGDQQGKTFAVTLDTQTNRWTASGPSVDMFFMTKGGDFKITGLPENGTQLVKLGPA